MPHSTPAKAINYQCIQSSIQQREKLGEGSHEIYRVVFQEQREMRRGFFKKLDDKYPEFLAKIAVAASCLQRVILGVRAAEERLVMQDNEIVGTLSIEIEGFEPFKYRGEPSAEKVSMLFRIFELLQKKIIELLFLAKYFANDDLHPGNWCPQGVIDMDMCYRFLVLILKPRVIPELDFFKITPQIKSLQDVGFTAECWSNFPCDKGGDAGWHWPTYQLPGENSLPKSRLTDFFLKSLLPKTYADSEQFVQLASEPEAHQQKITVALKCLLSYQPLVLAARLKEYLGDLTLDYKKLHETVVVEYESRFPELFSTQSNDAPFIDFMMKLSAQQYQNLYQIMVADVGGVNSYELTLEPMSEVLRSSSYYLEVLDWMQKENNIRYQALPALQFNLDEAKACYYQFRRKVYIAPIKQIQECLHEVFVEVYKELGAVDLFEQIVDKERFLEVPPLFVTEAQKKHFGEKHWAVVVVPKILALACGFKKALDDYYGYPDPRAPSNPSNPPIDNSTFLGLLSNLDKGGEEIYQEIPTQIEVSEKFKKVFLKIRALRETMNFEQHLLRTPTPIIVKEEGFDDLADLLQMQQNKVHAFFFKINKINAELFHTLLLKCVLEKDIKPSSFPFDFLSSKPKESGCKALLAKHRSAKNHHKLALVLQENLTFEASFVANFIDNGLQLGGLDEENSFLSQAIVDFVRSKDYADYNKEQDASPLPSPSPMGAAAGWELLGSP